MNATHVMTKQGSFQTMTNLAKDFATEKTGPQKESKTLVIAYWKNAPTTSP